MFSTFALGGLLAGLAFAAVDYFILLPLIERPMRVGMAELAPTDRERMERRIRIIRLFFAWQFLVFPVVGYLVGRALDSGVVS